MKKHKGSAENIIIVIILCVLAYMFFIYKPTNVDNGQQNYATNTTSVTSENIHNLQTSKDVVEAYKNRVISFEAVKECKERGILSDSDFEDLIILAFENGDIDELELGEFYQDGDIDWLELRGLNLSPDEIENIYDSGYFDVDNIEELYESGQLDKEDILDMRRDGSLDNDDVNEILSSY